MAVTWSMVIRRQLRDSEGIGSLKLLSALDLSTVAQRATGESYDVDELIRRFDAGTRASLNNPSRLHGLRTEAMFRAVLVALGSFQLLTEEDEGQVYYEDSKGPVKLPDYRVVDTDGRQLLIEVKTVPPNSRRLRHSIPAYEAHGLRRYGELTGAPVVVAHYWSTANLWTLVELERMQARDGRHEIELTEAMKFNQMSRFGDRMVGTVPPLELRLDVKELDERTHPNTATVVIKGTEMLAGGQPLVDQVEQRIAFLLFRYGGWDAETPAVIDSTGRLTSISLQAAPPQDGREIVQQQGFAIVGALSSMYSAMFNEITLDDEGAVLRLDHHSEPGELGSLIPADYFERSDRQLKLWVISLQPEDEDEGHQE